MCTHLRFFDKTRYQNVWTLDNINLGVIFHQEWRKWNSKFQTLLSSIRDCIQNKYNNFEYLLFTEYHIVKSIAKSSVYLLRPYKHFCQKIKTKIFLRLRTKVFSLTSLRRNQNKPYVLFFTVLNVRYIGFSFEIQHYSNIQMSNCIYIESYV